MFTGSVRPSEARPRSLCSPRRPTGATVTSAVTWERCSAGGKMASFPWRVFLSAERRAARLRVFVRRLLRRVRSTRRRSAEPGKIRRGPFSLCRFCLSLSSCVCQPLVFSFGSLSRVYYVYHVICLFFERLDFFFEKRQRKRKTNPPGKVRYV